MARSYVFAGVGGYYGSKQSGLAGVFCCATDDTNWKHALSEIEAFTVFAHPHDPNLVFAGTADGVYRSTDRGQNFHRAGFPDRGVQVWSFLHDDADPKCMLAGGSPVSIYRSEDGGASWKRLPDPHLPVHAKMPFSCRVMRFARHPGRSTEIFAVLEVSGVMHSTDGGESWSDRSADLLRLAEAEPRLRSKLVSDTEAEGMLDGHAVCTSSADPDSIIIAVRMGLFRSNDQGKSWQDMRVDRFSPFTYGRDIKVSPQDPNTLYACLSVAASSKDGALYRSQDVGKTWQRFDKVTPHGTLMSVGLHHADAKQVYVAARYGEVFGATTRAMIYSAICALRYPSLPVFPTPLPECQFDSLQNDVMDFAALLESRLPQGVVHGLGQVNACMDDAWARNGATSLAGCVGRQWRGSTALCHFATVRPS